MNNRLISWIAGWMLVATWLDCCAAEPDKRYVGTREGGAPKPIVAVDNVCAWPNLTLMNDGAIIATIFNQPGHGTMAGDVDCWATTDGGRTWQKRGTAAPHEPDTNRMNVAAGKANNGDLIVIASGWSNRYPEGKKGAPFRAGILAPWVSRSADGGRTWNVDKTSFPAKAPNGGTPIPFGDILPGQDGSLCVAIYTALMNVTPDGIVSRTTTFVRLKPWKLYTLSLYWNVSPTLTMSRVAGLPVARHPFQCTSVGS